jgi:hypothetical protein
MGDQIWISTKYIKTNKFIKKGDNKWTGPYAVTAVYPKTCAVKFLNLMRIFPVFHNSLLRLAKLQLALSGQDLINDAKSRYIKGRIFIKEDKKEEIVEKWKFDLILDMHNENKHYYLIQWKHHAPIWQPAANLKGQNETIMKYHKKNPDKCNPLNWVRRLPGTPTIAQKPALTFRRSSRLAAKQARF